MGSAPPNCKFSGLSDISAAKNIKGSNISCIPKEQIKTLGSFTATLIPEILIIKITPSSQTGKRQMMWDLWVERNS